MIDDQHPPPLRLFVAAFAAVYFIWGSTYLAILFAIETIPTFLMIGVRFAFGGVIMIALSNWGRDTDGRRPSASQWRDATISGVLLMGCGTGTVAWAEHRIPSSVAALMVATLPIWMVLFEAAHTRHWTSGARVIGGIVVGFAGVSFIIRPAGGFTAGSPIDTTGAVAVLIAAMLWALGSIYSRHASLPRRPALTAGMQTLCGGGILIVFGLILGEGGQLDLGAISTRSAISLAYLIVFGNIAFLAFSWLLKASTPARVSTYAYVNPVIAVILGWALAGEVLSSVQIAAALMIVASVAMIISFNRPKPIRNTNHESGKEGR